MDCDPSGSGRRDPTPPSYHTPPQVSPYSVEMEDPSSYPFPSSHFAQPNYPSVHPQMWSQAQLQQFQLAGRARDDRQYLTEDQRRELDIRAAMNGQYTGVPYGAYSAGFSSPPVAHPRTFTDSSPQNLADFFNPTVGPHFHPGPTVPSDRPQTFNPSQYEGRPDPYVPASYYSSVPFPPNLLPFGVPAYPSYGGVPYFQSVPSQRRPADDDGASIDAPTAESVENVGNWLQAGPFPPLPDDPALQGHEPPQASTSSSASSDVGISGAVIAAADQAGSWLANGDAKSYLRKAVRPANFLTLGRDWNLAVDELKDHPEFEQVFGQCRKLWEDRVLGKLGIPEFLEHDSDEQSRTYADLAGMLERGYPFEKTLDYQFDENRPHRRYVSFVWQRLRSRREKQPSTPTPTRSPSEESNDPSMVLAPHVRRTLDFNVEGATVISMYLTDWDMRTGTLFLHTSLAFDTNDIDDKAVISLGEMVPRMLAEREKWNAEHPSDPIPTPRHVWNTFQSSSSLLTARWTDLMTKRGFVNIEEYLSIHTDVDRQDFNPPPYGFLWQMSHPDWRPLGPMRPDAVTMCKFIAEDLDPVILERIRQIEMTKKATRRKRST
ncbi:hypothetical protein RhiXN_01791 [Rhizoctonia solani]|uniref:Uncharacterized protein n=1 Tax=Rhizoctonia solani TaxID=456999 RepID=A0A8H8P7V5_9AGAM|nr:uncharacterized protein RhiXN_01791 [Rhizoctonia solani]QRW27196.1 hypothetical protein RhiXN_01791 [Rhizoctonia solani]